MSILNNSLLLGADAGAAGYQVSRSLRFNAPDSAYLSKSFGSAGSRTTWTWCAWVKRCNLASQQTVFDGYADGSNRTQLMFESDNTFRVLNQVSGSVTTNLITTPVYRDASAWYHLLIAWDTTQGTSSNRVKIYINGSQVTTFSTSTYPGSSENSFINAANAHDIGRTGAYAEAYLSAYLAECYFVSGQALTPSSFTETDANGVLQPKAYTGSYGTNGFKLSFSDNASAAALGTDTSGNGNTWTVNNLSVTAGAGNDSLVDSPTNYGTDDGLGGSVRGNYCTWNPLAKNSALTLANGNLDDSTGTPGIDGIGLGTIGASVGKFYWEFTVNSTTGGNNPIIGVVPTSAGLIEVGSSNANSVGYLQGGNKRINGTTTSYGNSFTTGDVIGVALDLDNGAIYFSKNGTWQNSGVPTSGSSKTGAAHTWTGGSVEMTPAIREYNSGCSANWGARPFAYTAPSGFKALCTQNLPAPVIAQPSTAMDVKLYTGNGSTQTVSGLGFSPDLVWIKDRTQAGIWHNLFDEVRGAGKRLKSNGTDAEQTLTDLPAFNSDGFSVNNDNGILNTSSSAYVAWCWDAGSSTVTNTQGSITSSVRANASAGFSIVTYTGNGTSGATIGHGLGIVPSFFIVKRRDTTGNWNCYHASLGNTQGIYLDLTNAASASSALWNNTSPTSTVISLGNGSGINTSSSTYVCYAFAPVAGYSSFGSYTGNGSSDGPFVYTGFRSRWILIKQSSAAGENWAIFDTARDAYNVASTNLFPNLSSAEASASFRNIDILSNGFKIKNTDGTFNTNAATYLWAAFAESPFAYARAR